MIEVQDLERRFGEVTALNRLNLRVAERDVFGFIGPNGAGKTTTLRILATLLEPTAGDARIAGISVRDDPKAIRRLIGFIPDFFGVYEDMTVAEYLRFFAAAYRILGTRREQIVSDVLDLTDLKGKSDALVHSLSRGMQQRLSVARVLLHDPAILLLDEPASGLDPRARVEMRSLLQELSNMGKTILVSSHILWELGALCNRIGIIDNGTLKFCGTLEEARTKAFGGKMIVVEVRDRSGEAEAVLKSLPAVAECKREGAQILATLHIGRPDPAPLAEALTEKGFSVTRFGEAALDLEAVFQQLTGKAEDPACA
ncbi:MAG: ABC transporter ATP-binding protein [Planctomycetota bacterium]|jgi:ABC-2 type transport system ATP-binding protein